MRSRLREIWGDADSAEEADVLNSYLTLMDQESLASKRIREAQQALEARLVAKYGELSEDEVKALVVEGKWFAVLSSALQTEMDRVSQALTGRVRELADRYATPLPAIAEEVDVLSMIVSEHLERMGFAV